MKTQSAVSLATLPRLPLVPEVFVGVIRRKPYKELTELIVRLALCGPFHFIVGGEWIPDQDSLRHTVRRYTTAVNEILDHPILARPSTCLQLRDQLATADDQPHPIFLFDFLNRFYDPDVDRSLRERVLEECCQRVQRLARTKSVFILVPRVLTEDYQRFFPLLASTASVILEVEEPPQLPVIQYPLF